MKVIKIQGRNGMIDWPSWPTDTPHLVITPTLGHGDEPAYGWNVTHEPTGYRIGGEWDEPFTARFVAHRFGTETALDWGTVTVNTWGSLDADTKEKLKAIVAVERAAEEDQ